MSEDISKATLLGHCRNEVLETIIKKFKELAMHSDASSLEVLVAAVAFTLMAAEFIPNPTQRAAILNSLIGLSLH